MQNLTLRLIYPSSVLPQQLKAAQSGLEQFSRFGIIVESAPASARAFNDVRHPILLKGAAFAYEDIVMDPFLKMGLPNDPRSVFGIAITPHWLMTREEGEARRLAAIGGYLKSGVVSLQCSNEIPEPMKWEAIATAVKYEAGHLLIPSPEGFAPDCDNQCLMQKPHGFVKFVQEVVSNNLDFCKDCCHAIEETIRMRGVSLN